VGQAQKMYLPGFYYPVKGPGKRLHMGRPEDGIVVTIDFMEFKWLLAIGIPGLVVKF